MLFKNWDLLDTDRYAVITDAVLKMEKDGLLLLLLHVQWIIQMQPSGKLLLFP